MYGGHFGFALAARSAEPAVPLWVLVPAAFTPDLVGLFLAVAGLAPPVSDATGGSVAGTLLLALLLGMGWGVGSRSGRGGVLVGAVVASHSVGDLLEQWIPLWPGGPEVGAGLVETPFVNHGLQVAIVVAAWLLYRRTLPSGARGRGRGSPEAWGVLVLVLAAHAGSVVVRRLLAS